MNALKAKPGAGLRKFANTSPNVPVLPGMRLIRPTGSIQPQPPTRASPPDRKPLGQLRHQRSFAGGLYSFFASTSCRITLSSVQSATSCLSLRFSSSSCRNLRISAIPIWLYFLRQTYYVASLIPSFRVTSVTGALASTCRSAEAICSSESLLFFIVSPPRLKGCSVPHSSSFAWSTFWEEVRVFE